MKTPIHCVEKDKITPNNQKVLFANDIEGLGYYGNLVGYCPKTGKFLVKDIYGRLFKAIYIIEYSNS